MSIVTDPITVQIERFFIANGEKIVSAAKEDGFVNKYFPILIRDTVSGDKSESTQKYMNHLESLVRDICKKHTLWKLLILFRKLPAISYKFLENMLSSGESSESINPIFSESIFFGTNSILKYSTNEHNLAHCNDRYSFTAGEDELTDTIQLMVYCIFHRYLMFTQNSISHENIQEGADLNELLRLFNHRQEARVIPDPTSTTDRAIFSPAFIRRKSHEEKSLVYKNHTGKTITVIPKNYLPYPIFQDTELEKYAGLNCSEFEALTKISFDHWWKIWASLNQVIKNNVIFLWSDQEAFSSYEQKMTGAAIMADDYSDTALGCGIISSITETCHILLKKEYNELAPSLDECVKFFNFLCCNNLPGDPRFIEQPYLFYNVGPDRVFWDYFRHSGMMRALTRKLFGVQGKAKDRLRTHFASMFEKSVKQKIENSISKATAFKLNVKIKDELSGNLVWEIDSGFIYKNILFLVEVKNWLKNEKYYLADDPTLSDRVKKIESVLKEQDGNLEKYKQQIACRWDMASNGAICVVCTESVEFTASFNSKLWLKTGAIPRICLVDELISFLQSENLEGLYNHPNFVRFDF